MLHPKSDIEPASHPPQVRADGIQEYVSTSQPARKSKPEPDGTLSKVSVAELDNTLAMMANEASMMWGQLSHFERSEVSSAANASLIGKLTAVILDLEGDADSIKMYKEKNKEILTRMVCLNGKRQLWMARTHFENLRETRRREESLGVMLV